MSVAKSSFIFSLGTMLSRLSGLVRDSVMTAVFGASIYMDAYNVANRIPNLLRELLAEGALGASFTKVYAQAVEKDPEAAKKLLAHSLQLALVVTGLVTLAGIFWSEELVWLTTSSQKPQDLELLRTSATGMTQLLFPFILFASLGAIFQGVLYQQGRFFIAAVAPIALNVLNIAGALWFGRWAQSLLGADAFVRFGNAGIFGLALGTMLGGGAQAAVQLWGVWRPAFTEIRFRWGEWPWSSDVKKVLTLMAPMIIAASSGQVNVIVNSNFATQLQTGTVSHLANAFRLIQLPIGVFGVAVGSAVLPVLSRALAKSGGRVEVDAQKEMINALELVTWLMVTCSVVLFVNSESVTALLYRAGRFGAEDSHSTAVLVEGYAVGLMGYGLLKVLNGYYVAVGRTKFPMWVGVLSIGVNYFLNSYLVMRFGATGLATTASFVLTLNATILLIGISRDGWFLPMKKLALFLFLMLAAVVVTAKATSVFLQNIDTTLLLDAAGLTGTMAIKVDALIHLSLGSCVIVGVALGLSMLRLKMTPLTALQKFKQRRRGQ
jgi:putative peptidoglycan lipid II flippase